MSNTNRKSRTYKDLLKKHTVLIQDRPVATGNIQELQTQIQHHEVRKGIRLSYFYIFANINAYISILNTVSLNKQWYLL